MHPTYRDWSDVYFVTDRLTLPPDGADEEARRKLKCRLPSDFVDLMFRVGQGILCDRMILLSFEAIVLCATENRRALKQAKPDLSATPFRTRDLSQLIEVVDALDGHGIFIHPNEAGEYFWYHAIENKLSPCGATIDDAIRFALPTCDHVQGIPFVYFESQGTLNGFELYRPPDGEALKNLMEAEFDFISSIQKPSKAFLLPDRYALFYSEYGTHIHHWKGMERIVIWYDPTKKNSFIPELISSYRDKKYREEPSSGIRWEAPRHDPYYRQAWFDD